MDVRRYSLVNKHKMTTTNVEVQFGLQCSETNEILNWLHLFTDKYTIDVVHPT